MILVVATLVVMALLLCYMLAMSKVRAAQMPWRTRRATGDEMGDLLSYIDQSSGEFKFAKMMRDAGAPLASVIDKTQYCLPERGCFLELKCIQCDGAGGEVYSVMDELSLMSIKRPSDLIHDNDHTVWKNEGENVCLFFWISGDTANLENNVFLNYDAACMIYELLRGRR